MKARERWSIEVWPVGTTIRFRDVHPEHRASDDVDGRQFGCGRIESVGRLFRRDYYTLAARNRAVGQLRARFPGDLIESTRFEFRVFAWFQSGDVEKLDRKAS
jgi:hypothetical protein